MVTLYDRTTDRRELHDLSVSRPDMVAALEAQLTAVESGFRAKPATSMSADTDARRRLEALGYVDAVPSATASAADGGARRT